MGYQKVSDKQKHIQNKIDLVYFVKKSLNKKGKKETIVGILLS